MTYLGLVLVTLHTFKNKLGVVNANNIGELNFNCVPCMMFGGYYCFDDPWKVVMNGDYCFENAVDKFQCSGKFSNYYDNCTVFADQLQPWGECEGIKQVLWKKWELPMYLNFTLPPRTTCGFHLFATDAKANVTYKYPTTLNYNQTGEQLNFTNTSSLVWRGEMYAPADCVTTYCTQEFLIQEEMPYFYFANWDRQKSQTILFFVEENVASMLKLKPISKVIYLVAIAASLYIFTT